MNTTIPIFDTDTQGSVLTGFIVSIFAHIQSRELSPQNTDQTLLYLCTVTHLPTINIYKMFSN